MNARYAAYLALLAVTRDGAYTAFALKKHIPADMSPSDRRFASRLVRTALENLIRIDYALDLLIRSGRVHGSVRSVLRLGAAQMLFLDTQGYAAVDESVRLVKRIKPQMAGFVNAVLRALQREKDSIEYPSGDTALALSVAHSYPLWICEKYIRDFGFALAKALLSYREPDGTAVRANTIKTDGPAFTGALDRLGLGYEALQTRNAFRIKGLSDIENLGIYRNGWLAVQSESAMRAVQRTKIGPGDCLLDACAAPGGKSAYAAALAENRLDILAWDIHAHRVEMTIKNHERLGVRGTQVQQHDATVPRAELQGRFDVVVVDAPCSAMGLMAKNPDVRYSRRPGDIAELAHLQQRILSTCAGYTRAGGTLAYYTCSINAEENRDVTDAFVAQHSGFDYAQEPETLFPHIVKSDGFYIAILKRKP